MLRVVAGFGACTFLSQTIGPKMNHYVFFRQSFPGHTCHASAFVAPSFRGSTFASQSLQSAISFNKPGQEPKRKYNQTGRQQFAPSTRLRPINRDTYLNSIRPDGPGYCGRRTWLLLGRCPKKSPKDSDYIQLVSNLVWLSRRGFKFFSRAMSVVRSLRRGSHSLELLHLTAPQASAGPSGKRPVPHVQEFFNVYRPNIVPQLPQCSPNKGTNGKATTRAECRLHWALGEALASLETNRASKTGPQHFVAKQLNYRDAAATGSSAPTDKAWRQSSGSDSMS